MIGVLVVALILATGLALAFWQRVRQGDNPPLLFVDDPTMHDCPRCGNSIAVDWAFCPFCARALSTEDIAAPSGERNLPVAHAGRS